MSRARSLAVFAAAAATIAGLAVPAGANPRDRMDVQAANPAGLVPVRDAHGSGGSGGGGSVNMSGHGGPVLTATQVPVAVFWGPKWGTSPGDKITGMDSWYGGFGNSNYAATSNEYSGSNGKVTSTVSFPTTATSQNYVDTTASAGGGNAGTILSEVGKALLARGLTPQTNGYYPVYVDTARGNANYCAWHSWGTINGVMVQFAFFFWLDGDPGCDPQSSVSGESQGLAAIANVSGHELSEARTDPQGTGWFDRQGAENGDKCAWSFSASSVTFSNGWQWKIQGEWSNAAYNSQTGYPNRSGQKGCLQGA